jgi:hypothetical protein
LPWDCKMKKDKNFYKMKDKISSKQKKRIWKAIKSEMDIYKDKTVFIFEWKNYSLGIATCLLLLFALIGINSLFMLKSYNDGTELALLNKTYNSTIIKAREDCSSKKLQS